MDENLRDIDQLFKAALDDYSENPPGFVWDNIDKGLGEPPNPPPPAAGAPAFLSLPGWIIAFICLLPLHHSRTTASKYVGANHIEMGGEMNSLPLSDTMDPHQGVPLQSQGESPADILSREKQQNELVYRNLGGDLPDKAGNPRKPRPILENGAVENIVEASTGKTRNTKKLESDLKVGSADHAEADEFTQKAAAKNSGKEGQRNINNEILAETGTVMVAATTGNFPARSKNNFEGGKEGAGRNQTAILPPNGAVKQDISANAEEGIVFMQAGYQAKEDETTTSNAHARLVQPLMQSVGIKRVPKSYAIPVVPNRNASSGAIDAAMKAPSKHRDINWSVTGFYRPEWQQSSMGRIENDRHDGPRNDRHAIRQQAPKISSYTTGLQGGLQLGNGLMIESGLTLFEQTSTQGGQILHARPDSGGSYKLRFDFAEGYCNVNLKNGAPPNANDSVTIASATTKIKYVGIPLQVSYPFRFGKFYAIPTTGITFQWRTSGTMEAQVQQGQDKHPYSEDKINGLKNNFLSGQAGLSLEYKLAPSIRLQLAPTYRFSFSPVNKGAAVQYFPAAWGVGMGLRWNLK